jgi:hypothetical protein
VPNVTHLLPEEAPAVETNMEQAEHAMAACFKHRYALRTPIARTAMAIPSSSRHGLLRSR